MSVCIREHLLICQYKKNLNFVCVIGMIFCVRKKSLNHTMLFNQSFSVYMITGIYKINIINTNYFIII